jgi:transcriptional regulator with XRE-family HTH domain
VSDPLAQNLAANVRRLREDRGLSQQQMADLSGVPRPTWANLESGDANPTIGVLTRVADALQVGVEDLLRSQHSITYYPARSLPERTNGKVRVRKLMPGGQPGMEIERLDLAPSSELAGKPHPSGTREYLTCEKGELELFAGGQTWKLKSGDVVAFRSETPHSYRNTGRTQTIAYSVVTFAPVRG